MIASLERRKVSRRMGVVSISLEVIWLMMGDERLRESPLISSMKQIHELYTPHWQCF